MMQAPEPAKRSPWALRLAISGGVMLLLGAILMQSQASTISSVMDPREQHHGAYTGEGTYRTDGLSDTCYRFYQEEGGVPLTAQLYRVEGDTMVGEALDQKKCLLDWQPMTADGKVMVERSTWTLNDSGEFAVVVSCEEECSETTGWFVSVDDVPENLMGSTSLLFGGALCCLGVLTTPVALIVYFASKPSRSPRVMMVGEDGRLIPITDVNPDHPTLFEQPDVTIPSQPKVAPPFADTAEHQPSEAFVDGLNDVAAGSLLTTEQVYALMRGDVEGAQEHAKTGRYQTTSAEEAIQDAANAAAIASWDEGVPLAEPKAVERKTAVTARKTGTSESAAPTKAWKDWDDQ
jgi:hypothetical protein